MTDLTVQCQLKTDIQHVLDRPDTYIGSVQFSDANMWTFDQETGKMVLKNIAYNVALYKLFDEGILNCRDHVIRMLGNEGSSKVTYIETTIDDDGTIIFVNDGCGIDIAVHPTHKIYIPELIFGNMRSSTNYDTSTVRRSSGLNGIGIKLAFIWSTEASVETVDVTRGLKYTQRFLENLSIIEKPTITKVKTTKPYTCVSFKPDYARFGIQNLSPDMISLLKKRTYDIAALTDSTSKVKMIYNKEVLPVKNFLQYVDLYIGKKDGDIGKREYEKLNERWEVCISISPTQQFEQVSFVNGICTYKGGKYVDYVLGQILRKVQAYIEKKKKIVVNINTIKEQLIIFLRSDIENPNFDSQTKECMNTPSNKFGSTCTVSDEFAEKVAKLGVMDTACALSEIKESKIAKNSDGSKTRTVRGIANFVYANSAGTAQSNKCILILCEGLSAMSGVVSGLSSEDRNLIGIYPLKGKLLNVRGELVKRIAENKEITDLKRILGLESGKEYKSIDDVNKVLRYGKVMFLTDSDSDGSHIKGLCVNLFQSEWASLFRISGFLSFMNTPILRAIKGQQTKLFYNEGEYNTWKDELPEQSTAGWTIKYFKGLGTSSSAEFKEYFANKKIVDFVYTDATTDDVIDKIFNKKRPDERKLWLSNYNKSSYLNTSLPQVKYEEFIDKELIHFSVYDCERSIPNIVDGMKTSQRKIMYCAFKRNLVKEIKAAQFSGYISEHANYHHGENSLHSTTISMCQDFVGANNINILEPKGQFGSRLNGGNDSASERYIYTNLSPLTRKIFPENDDSVLNYICDDGHMVEPDFYVPIIPYVLINGVSGIGTGFSTNIPPFNPQQVIDVIKTKLNDTYDQSVVFIPYHENFKGMVSSIPDEPNKFSIKGKYTKIDDNNIRITELPIGTWTMPYISFLEILLDGNVDKLGKKLKPTIADFTSNSTEKFVDIRVTFPAGNIADLEESVDSNNVNGVEKILKLSTSVSTTNMHLFDKEFKLRKYLTVHDIVNAFYDVRIDTYTTRKEHMIAQLKSTLFKLSNKALYIQLVLDDTIDLRRKNTSQIDDLLSKNKLGKIDDSFDYLIKMPTNSVSQENIDKLLKEKSNNELELQQLQNTTVQSMWLHELNNFESQYNKYILKRNNDYGTETVNSTNKKQKMIVRKK